MSEADVNEILSTLHTRLASELLKILESGEATPSQLEVIRKFLSDNSIQAHPSANRNMMILAEQLPFDGSESP